MYKDKYRYEWQETLESRRVALRCIFEKMPDEDLIRMYNILQELDIQWFALSFCIEILWDRWYDVYNLPKHVLDKI